MWTHNLQSWAYHLSYIAVSSLGSSNTDSCLEFKVKTFSFSNSNLFFTLFLFFWHSFNPWKQLPTLQTQVPLTLTIFAIKKITSRSGDLTWLIMQFHNWILMSYFLYCEPGDLELITLPTIQLKNWIASTCANKATAEDAKMKLLQNIFFEEPCQIGPITFYSF
jgi:hypothetical protein